MLVDGPGAGMLCIQHSSNGRGVPGKMYDLVALCAREHETSG